MATVQEILNEKGSFVHQVAPTLTVLDATRMMNEHKVGALVVTDGDRLLGMFTERDVLRRVVGEERSPAEVVVADVMTTEVACCCLETTLDEARGVMKNRRIRHLPVVDEQGTLHGLVSIGDLNAFHSGDQETTIHMLHEYLYGRQ